MLHDRVETKQEAVHLGLEEHLTYVEVASRLAIRKPERIEVWVRKYRQEGEPSFHKPIGPQAEQRELERLRMKNALLKKFRTELQGVRLARRNIGPSITTKKNSK